MVDEFFIIFSFHLKSSQLARSSICPFSGQSCPSNALVLQTFFNRTPTNDDDTSDNDTKLSEQRMAISVNCRGPTVHLKIEVAWLYAVKFRPCRIVLVQKYPLLIKFFFLKINGYTWIQSPNLEHDYAHYIHWRKARKPTQPPWLGGVEDVYKTMSLQLFNNITKQ